MKKIALLLSLLLVPAHALAAGWLLGGEGSPKKSVTPGNWVSFDPTATGDDTDIIDVSSCENLTVKLFDDKAGDNTPCTETYHLDACPGNKSTLTTAAVRDFACAQETGSGTLSGDDVERGYDGVFMRLQSQSAGANDSRIDHCRIVLFCAGPSTK